MTLGNMRANGVRSLAVSCLTCHHKAVLAVDAWPECAACGITGELERTAGATEPDGRAPQDDRC
jgi:hypothetical protein